jgi:hypothetical protein
VELQAGQEYSMLGLHSGRARERGAATEQEVSNQREVHKVLSRKLILSHGIYLNPFDPDLEYVSKKPNLFVSKFIHL